MSDSVLIPKPTWLLIMCHTCQTAAKIELEPSLLLSSHLNSSLPNCHYYGMYGLRMVSGELRARFVAKGLGRVDLPLHDGRCTLGDHLVVLTSETEADLDVRGAHEVAKFRSQSALA